MKLMIVEDDSFILQIYHQLFKLEGIEVITAADGMEALEKLKNEALMPDAIVLDIMMPKMDGFQFLSEQHKLERLKDIPVVVLTNLFSEEDAAKAKKLGAKEVILKSKMDPKDLVLEIKRVLGIGK